MALIQCPKCGKEFSDRARKCPLCGTPMEEVQRLIKEQAEREAAERERICKEREAKEAEEARIRAEKRAAWWAANKKKIGIAILVVIGVIAAIIGIKTITNMIAAKKAVADAYELIEQGDQLVATYHFDEARELFDSACKKTNDSEVQKQILKSTNKLAGARQFADLEYNKALRRLRVLLDADDNEFNQYSNECLDKMIEIYPNKQETIYYKRMRDGSSGVDATTSASYMLQSEEEEYEVVQ